MPIIGLTADGKKIVALSTTGPASYNPTAGYTVTVPELARVDAVLFASIDGGYRVANATKTGNTVTLFFHYFDYDSTSDGTSINVPNGTDLSGRAITLVVIGS